MSVSDLLFPNQYRRRVLAWLVMHPQEWVHLRELARSTGASAGTLKKELDALTKAGLLTSRKVGNQSQFCANTEHPVYPELSGLIRKTIGLCDLLTVALKPLTDQVKVAFVFGSMANGTEKTRSDVDVMVIGEDSFGEVVNALYDAQSILGREINPKVMTDQEWHANQAEGNVFVHELLRKPKLFIVGADHDL